ncbi:MAG: F0F1 ATP synthase subunit epsilon [Caldilineaceae bacterium]|nr:F0F1 ATP synthase subunit epsilon [Caldilineaceae bacterium]MCB0126026.1 F0F1 ATP synthase subunit epsilon [Caldilineaceae bacterium]
MSILVDIVTPERQLLSRQVDMVTLPGIDGQMGILGGHVPLLTTLDIGEIVLHEGNETDFIAVSGGVVEVRPNKVTIMADTAEHAEEIDVDRAEAARERARTSLSEAGPQRDPSALAALRRSNLRIRVAHRRRSGRSGPRFDEAEQE